MIAALTLAAIAATPSPELCRSIDPAATADPVLATTYLSVGDDEAAAQRPESALAAYREALRFDPANATARAKWQELCQSGGQSSQDFEDAVRLMEAGDRRAAAEKFKSIRTSAPDPGAALLEGICRYELHDDAEALEALKLAETEPSLNDAVQFFRGLIALRQGRSEEAEKLFRQATSSSDPRLQGGAVDLLRLTQQQSRLVLSVQVESGYDSNVSLTADGDPSLGAAGDGFASTAGTVLWHPFKGKGGYLVLGGQYRKQFSSGLFDLGAANGTAGWLFSSDSVAFGAEYSFDYLTVGGDSYLQAHRLGARLRKSFERLALSAQYSLRRENFVPENERDFSGYRQFGQLDAAWVLSGGSAIAFGYRAGMDATQTAQLSYREHGPVISGGWRVAKPVRLTAELGGWWREYGDVWNDTGDIRADRVLDAGLAGDWFLTERWSVRGQVSFRRVVSNLSAFTFSKLTGSLGVAYTAGLF